MENLKYTQDTWLKYQAQRERMNEDYDCTVRALAIAINLPYEVAHKICKDKFGREDRKGFYIEEHFWKLKKVDRMDVFYASKEEFKRWYGKKSFKHAKFNTDYTGKGITVSRFIKDNPNGTFIVTVSGHAFTIKDGLIYGNESDLTAMRKKIRVSFRIAG